MSQFKFDSDMLGPILIGAVWVIMQLVGAAKKKSKPTGTAATKPAGPSFAELFAELTGAVEPEQTKPIKKAKPVARTEPAPEPVIDAPTPVASMVESVHIDRPTLSGFKMDSMKMPSMSLRLSGKPHGESSLRAPNGLFDPADRNALHRAIVSQMILGKPKALEAPAGPPPPMPQRSSTQSRNER